MEKKQMTVPQAKRIALVLGLCFIIGIMVLVYLMVKFPDLMNEWQVGIGFFITFGIGAVVSILMKRHYLRDL
jgi:hypothetical protein